MTNGEEPRFTVEEVEDVAAPRRARVEDIPEPPETPPKRRRSWSASATISRASWRKSPGVSAGEPGGETYEAVIDALREIFDPKSRSTSMTWG
jgi:hypothetical protein